MSVYFSFPFDDNTASVPGAAPRVSVASSKTAAFFRVEGALVDRGALAACAYFASNGQGFAERALRVGALALAAPVFGVLRQNDRTMATRAAYVSLRHMSEDRIAELAEEYFDDLLRERIFDKGRDLIKQARKDGHRVVLLSEGLSYLVESLAEELGADDFVCNHLEFVDGECTGKLVDPVVGGHDGGRWARDYAEEHGLDLEHSVAYAGNGPDLLLLAAVGNPCAVNPDFTLRGAARDADWPVMEYRG